ncbi:MAG: SurA N-terminal domain-containing protein [Candidatus Shapirobacteria bacterium]|jgi:foldase protein PrsA
MKKITNKTTKRIVKKESEAAVVSQPLLTKTHKKINFPLILGLIIIAAAVYAYYRFGVVATVNGKPISRLAYLETLEKQDKKQTITQLVNEALVYQEAAKQKVTVDQSVIDAEVKKVEAQITAQGQTLDAALTSEGMTLADLENEIRLQKTAEKLANPQVTVTQAEIDKFLVDNKTALPTGSTKEQLQTMATEQLSSQAQSDAVNTWFSNLKKAAQIIIR